MEETLRRERAHAKKEAENLSEDLRIKSLRLSETNVALANAAAKIEELGELKMGYQAKARESEREVRELRAQGAELKDLAERLGRENRDFRKHLKFKDREIIRISKEKKLATEKLESELRLQVENNRNILNRMKKRTPQETEKKGSEDSENEVSEMSGDEEDIRLFAS